MKFGSKKAIFGVIWGGFEVFGPCLGVSHPTHPHLGEISQKKRFFFLAASLTLTLSFCYVISILIFLCGIQLILTLSFSYTRFDFFYIDFICHMTRMA